MSVSIACARIIRRAPSIGWGVGDAARLRAIAACLCASGAIALTASCGDEPPRTSQPTSASPAPASTGPAPTGNAGCSPAELARAADCATLVRAVRQRRSVAVIVTLSVAFTPEGDLDAAAVRGQRKAIEDAQSQLIAELAPAGARVTTRFTTTPLIALVVDEAALRQLLASPRVLRIQADAPQPPTG